MEVCKPRGPTLVRGATWGREDGMPTAVGGFRDLFPTPLDPGADTRLRCRPARRKRVETRQGRGPNSRAVLVLPRSLAPESLACRRLLASYARVCEADLRELGPRRAFPSY